MDRATRQRIDAELAAAGYTPHTTDRIAGMQYAEMQQLHAAATDPRVQALVKSGGSGTINKVSGDTDIRVENGQITHRSTADRQRTALAAYTALLERYMSALVEAGEAAQQQRNGRELAIFERDFEKIAALVAALVNGNYLDTACRLSDIAYSGVRAWLAAFDAGEARYETVGRLIRAAESFAEAEAVMLVRTAGNDPRFWAAPATWLERKYPEKYGRRLEDSSTPRVIVQVGGNASDVRVLIASEPTPPRFACSTEGDLRAGLPTVSLVAEANATDEPRSDPPPAITRRRTTNAPVLTKRS